MLHAFLFLRYFNINFHNLCIRTYVYVCMPCAMGHGIVLPAMDSSTLNSSAMDSSAIGVGVAVLVGKINVCKDPAALCLIFGVSGSR